MIRRIWFRTSASCFVFLLVLFIGALFFKHNKDANISNAKSVTEDATFDYTVVADLQSSNNQTDNTLEFNLKKGESMASVLSKAGVAEANILAMEKCIKIYTNPRKLPVGTRVIVTPSNGIINKLELYLDNRSVITLERDNKLTYKARISETVSNMVLTKVSGVTSHKSTISSVANQLGASPKIVTGFAKLYEGVADLRQLPVGSKFEILFERYFDQDGNILRDGKIVYASLDSPKVRKRLYLLKDRNGSDRYYNEAGKLINQMHFTSPLKVHATISSKYGMRKHPISGKWKMHNGVDLAAPSGSKIHATADGVISFVGYNKGYGNYIKISHGSKYVTLYAHLRGFAQSLKVGQRVAQGQHIGFVGSTGYSTGPHLHYEIMEKLSDGRVKHSDPLGRIRYDNTSPGHDLVSFQDHIRNIETLIVEAPYAITMMSD